MKRVMLCCAIIIAIIISCVYLVCFLNVRGEVPIWRLVISAGCCLLGVVFLVLTILSLQCKSLSVLLDGHRFELLQLALITLLLSFVIITV